MTKENSFVVICAQGCRTDDNQKLEQIMQHLNEDVRFDYMRRDGGGLIVESFNDDLLLMNMRENCGICTPIKIAGTRRHVQLSLEDDFPEVDIAFQDTTTPSPTFSLRF